MRLNHNWLQILFVKFVMQLLLNQLNVKFVKIYIVVLVFNNRGWKYIVILKFKIDKLKFVILIEFYYRHLNYFNLNATTITAHRFLNIKKRKNTFQNAQKQSYLVHKIVYRF